MLEPGLQRVVHAERRDRHRRRLRLHRPGGWGLRGSGDMKNVFWFVFGIASGFVLAHLVNKDPRGHEVLAPTTTATLTEASA